MHSEGTLPEEDRGRRPPPSTSSPCPAWFFRLRSPFFRGSKTPVQERGQYSITASYAGDPNYTASNSTPVVLNLQADFTVADRGTTSQTVTAGQTAQYVSDIAVTPVFGFSSTVTATCTVPARGTTCTVNPSSYSTASGMGVGSVMVTTMTRGGGFIRPTDPLPFPSPILPVTVVAVLLCTLAARLWRRGPQPFSRAFALVLLTIIVGISAAGCGGGAGGTSYSPPPPPQTGTLAGTYIVTVTGTSNSVTHTMTITLVVQ
jgi:hypothetical protein